MPTFLDTKNRKWQPVLTVAAMLRWREACPAGPDPMDIQPVIAMLANDPLGTCQAAAAVLAPDLKAANTTADDFLASMTGSTAAAAMNAMAEEYRLFFVLADRRALVDACLALEAAKALERRTKARKEQATCGTPSGGAPAAPESIPAPSATPTS